MECKYTCRETSIVFKKMFVYRITNPNEPTVIQNGSTCLLNRNVLDSYIFREFKVEIN